MGKENGKKRELALRGLAPTPEERWELLRRFLNLGQEDLQAMAATGEVLMERGTEFVKETYAYLSTFPETAHVLGWENGVDEAHLEERRRFFTIWFARTIGLDLGTDMAAYLFRAGKWHAGHGPRAIHTPEIFVTGSISLTQAAFARYLADALTDASLVARALAGWNKVLTMHLDLMLAGYRAAQAIAAGQGQVTIQFYNKLRPLLGLKEFRAGVSARTMVDDLLRRTFEYFPQARTQIFDERLEAPANGTEEVPTWLEELERVYVLRPSWTILHNGVNLRWRHGFQVPVEAGDTVSVFPPTR